MATLSSLVDEFMAILASGGNVDEAIRRWSIEKAMSLPISSSDLVSQMRSIVGLCKGGDTIVVDTMSDLKFSKTGRKIPPSPDDRPAWNRKERKRREARRRKGLRRRRAQW